MDYEALVNEVIKDLKESCSKIEIGFEKESLRVEDYHISNSPHPISLGSAMSNKYITTDFSEAQLELITPPLIGNKNCIEILDNIHHFVSRNIDNQILWPFSMPPHIRSDDDIPIALYGSSHEGRFKHVYRVGLANRYGRSMQSISGFHFNYSLPRNLWNYSNSKDQIKLDKLRNYSYFNILRNIHKMNWLLLYLFGASPVIEKSLINKEESSFERLDENFYLLPHATSLRMSEYGYSNLDRRNIPISINSMSEYIFDLRNAASTEDKKYLHFEIDQDNQLNSNILQIEAEYYAVARAKSSSNESKRPSTNLENGGVDFIEIRSLDLNPFSRVGIDEEAILFIEIFMIYCFILESEPISNSHLESINRNDLKVSKFGREPNLCLERDKKQALMSDWANEILERMIPFAEQLNDKHNSYTKTIEAMQQRIDSPEETLSAKIINELQSKNYSYSQLGYSLGKKYKDIYAKRSVSENKFWDTLVKEKDLSNIEQKNLEKSSSQNNQTFNDFKENYYKD